MSTIGATSDAALLTACNLAVADVNEILMVEQPTINITTKNVTGIFDYPNLAPRFDDMSFTS